LAKGAAVEWLRRASAAVILATFSALIAWITAGNLSGWVVPIATLGPITALASIAFIYSYRALKRLEASRSAARSHFKLQLRNILYRGHEISASADTTREDVQSWLTEAVVLLKAHRLDNELSVILSPRVDSDPQQTLRGVVDGLRNLMSRADTIELQASDSFLSSGDALAE
jgi:hypothetical protein